MPVTVQYIIKNSKPRYTGIHFLGDLFMTFITCGLWLVWLFYKFLSR